MKRHHPGEKSLSRPKSELTGYSITWNSVTSESSQTPILPLHRGVRAGGWCVAQSWPYVHARGRVRAKEIETFFICLYMSLGREYLLWNVSDWVALGYPRSHCGWHRRSGLQFGSKVSLHCDPRAQSAAGGVMAGLPANDWNEWSVLWMLFVLKLLIVHQS